MPASAAISPPASVSRAPARRRERWIAAVVFTACAGGLALGFRLAPDPSGLGTHAQLGLPQCGMLAATSVPCPTCGCTTAFSLATHGRLFNAFHTQPTGAALAVAAAVMVWISGYAWWRGVSLAPLGRRLVGPIAVWTLAGLFLLAWCYKIVNVLNMQGAT
ncbi:MAG: hypothetical protein CMJ18_17310 [Phycisphaeraceae bacterium]|nr:hypothetical protein [Phycisphaeraceae bacterium]